MAKLIEPLADAPEAFADVAKKLNEAIAILRSFQGMIGSGPIDVSIADANTLISIDPTVLLPDARAGSMLYSNGTGWVLLNAPTDMTINPVLRYNLDENKPYWEEPEDC